MELGRKVGTGTEPTTKKLMEFQESERQRKKLEEINLKLRLQLEDLVIKLGLEQLAFVMLSSMYSNIIML